MKTHHKEYFTCFKVVFLLSRTNFHDGIQLYCHNEKNNKKYKDITTVATMEVSQKEKKQTQGLESHSP